MSEAAPAGLSIEAIPTVKPQSEAAAEAKTPAESRWLNPRMRAHLKAHRPLRRVVLIIFASLSVPAVVAIFWGAWVYLIPALYDWGIAELRESSGVVDALAAAPAAIAAGFGIMFLAIIPIGVLPIVFGIGSEIATLYLEDDVSVVAEAVKRGSSEQATVEEELGKIDKSGLVLLLRYSRIQLEQYYAIGLTQTQRSFKYGVIAMWIGFAVIMAGIVLTAVDVQRLNVPLRNDSSYIAFASGLVIEVISALFLWLYRRSIKQLTYFYDRQMYNHSVLMCFRIAETMQPSDAVKQAIVERVLDRSWAHSEEELPSGKALLAPGRKNAEAAAT